MRYSRQKMRDYIPRKWQKWVRHNYRQVGEGENALFYRRSKEERYGPLNQKDIWENWKFWAIVIAIAFLIWKVW